MNFPQTVFSCRGSHGVGKGALHGARDPVICRRSYLTVNMQSKWMVPSKTQCNIDILGNFLHYSWEVYHFLPPGASWSLLELPGASWSLLEPPGASWSLPDASQMALRWYSLTRRHVFLFNKNTCFLFNKKTCLLVQQEDMFSCSTSRHVLFFNKKTCFLLKQEDIFFYNKKTCCLLQQEDIFFSSKTCVLLQQEDMFFFTRRHVFFFSRKTCSLFP